MDASGTNGKHHGANGTGANGSTGNNGTGANGTPPKVHTGKRRRSSGDWRPAFLATLRKTCNVRAACEKAKITRRTAYDHRDADPDFAADWKEAMEDGVDRLEQWASKRAEKSSDLLLIFLLKAHRPEKYRERYEPPFIAPTPTRTQTNIQVNLQAVGDEQLDQLSRLIGVVVSSTNGEPPPPSGNGTLPP